MKAGFVGLGRMGGNMVTRLVKGGHEIVAYDPSEVARKEAEKHGAKSSDSLQGIVNQLSPPRVVWLMVPSGHVTQEVIDTLQPLLEKGDILIDGGNSNYKDSMSRAASLKEKGISFLDAGTSGGIWGLDVGYCLMVGGEAPAFAGAEPLFRCLAPENGYAHVGPGGAGHFVKMVHNGIEYAMLEAYGEGFEIMNAKKEFDLDLGKISELWNHGSVVRSWLLELAVRALNDDPKLSSIAGYVEDTGEGRWTVVDAIESGVPAPTIALSLLQRFRSRQEESFSAKVIAALRNQFGGHAVKKEEKG
jgi:6-phosphogluconate dehydrogenase